MTRAPEPSPTCATASGSGRGGASTASRVERRVDCEGAGRRRWPRANRHAGCACRRVAASGAIYTPRTFALYRQGQITDRLMRAMDELGNVLWIASWYAVPETRLQLTNGRHSKHDHQEKIGNAFSIHDDMHAGMPGLVSDTSRRSILTREHFDDDASIITQRQPRPNSARRARRLQRFAAREQQAKLLRRPRSLEDDHGLPGVRLLEGSGVPERTGAVALRADEDSHHFSRPAVVLHRRDDGSRLGHDLVTPSGEARDSRTRSHINP
jgi:hypothetical protein